MSNEEHSQLVRLLGDAVQAFQDSTDLFDEAAAARLGINRTDLRCLGVIAARGPVSVGAVAKAVSLTRGAATTALDRIERKGLARRIRHPSDRRGVLMELTDKARIETEAIWAPMVEAGAEMMAQFSVPELRSILRYLQEGRRIQLDYLARESESSDTGKDHRQDKGSDQ